MPGKNKLFEKIQGIYMIRRVIDEIVLCHISEILLVHQKRDTDPLKRIIPSSVKLIENESPERGMTFSIQKALQHAQKKSQGYMICLGDMPFVKNKDYEWLMKMFFLSLEQNDKAMVAPTHRGRRGNPVIFSSFYRHSLIDNSEPDGCKNIVKKYTENLIEVEIDHPGILKDIDTEEDLRKYNL